MHAHGSWRGGEEIWRASINVQRRDRSDGGRRGWHSGGRWNRGQDGSQDDAAVWWSRINAGEGGGGAREKDTAGEIPLRMRLRHCLDPT